MTLDFCWTTKMSSTDKNDDDCWLGNTGWWTYWRSSQTGEVCWRGRGLQQSLLPHTGLQNCNFCLWIGVTNHSFGGSLVSILNVEAKPCSDHGVSTTDIDGNLWNKFTLDGQVECPSPFRAPTWTSSAGIFAAGHFEDTIQAVRVHKAITPGSSGRSAQWWSYHKTLAVLFPAPVARECWNSKFINVIMRCI